MFALSTSWNALRYSRAEDIIEQIRSLGFSAVELNFNLTPRMVQGMIKLQKAGRIKVTSVHNFCPLPAGVPRRKASADLYSLASRDEQTRKKAVFYTKQTIDTACALEARAVVLHAGRIKMREQIRQLSALQFQSADKFKLLKARMLKQRKDRAGIFLAQVFKSLEALCKYAQKQKIKLGLENRYYFSEIPSAAEMEVVLKSFPAPALYYWHDVGHAQVYENLGFLKHAQMLKKFGSRMIGVHLHDIEGIDDHRAPLQGKFDFRLLKPYVKKTTIKVIEAHWPATADQIIRGAEYLSKILK